MPRFSLSKALTKSIAVLAGAVSAVGALSGVARADTVSFSPPPASVAVSSATHFAASLDTHISIPVVRPINIPSINGAPAWQHLPSAVCKPNMPEGLLVHMQSNGVSKSKIVPPTAVETLAFCLMNDRDAGEIRSILSTSGINLLGIDFYNVVGSNSSKTASAVPVESEITFIQGAKAKRPAIVVTEDGAIAPLGSLVSVPQISVDDTARIKLILAKANGTAAPDASLLAANSIPPAVTPTTSDAASAPKSADVQLAAADLPPPAVTPTTSDAASAPKSADVQLAAADLPPPVTPQSGALVNVSQTDEHHEIKSADTGAQVILVSAPVTQIQLEPLVDPVILETPHAKRTTFFDYLLHPSKILAAFHAHHRHAEPTTPPATSFPPTIVASAKSIDKPGSAESVSHPIEVAVLSAAEASPALIPSAAAAPPTSVVVNFNQNDLMDGIVEQALERSSVKVYSQVDAKHLHHNYHASNHYGSYGTHNYASYVARVNYGHHYKRPSVEQIHLGREVASKADDIFGTNPVLARQTNGGKTIKPAAYEAKVRQERSILDEQMSGATPAIKSAWVLACEKITCLLNHNYESAVETFRAPKDNFEMAQPSSQVIVPSDKVSVTEQLVAAFKAAAHAVTVAETTGERSDKLAARREVRAAKALIAEARNENPRLVSALVESQISSGMLQRVYTHDYAARVGRQMRQLASGEVAQRKPTVTKVADMVSPDIFADIKPMIVARADVKGRDFQGPQTTAAL